MRKINKKIKVILIILVLILLIPIRVAYKDGGSIGYRAILYQITIYHYMNGQGGYTDGWGIDILGFQVFEHTYDID